MMAEPGGAIQRDDTWARTVRMWHLAFYVMITISIFAMVSAVTSPGGQAVSLGAMAALVLAC